MTKYIQQLVLVAVVGLFGLTPVRAQVALEVSEVYASAHLVADSNRYEYKKEQRGLKDASKQTIIVNSKNLHGAKGAKKAATNKENAKKDSVIIEYTQIRISFLVNNPSDVARVNFMIGQNVGSNEIFTGIASIDNHRDILYSVFNGDAFQVEGNKVVIYWTGSKKDIEKAKYVTVKLQTSNGKESNLAFALIKKY